MAAQVWDSNLPPGWSSLAMSDGRIFFLNEDTKTSTWLHPVTGVSVQTGHKPLPDLPKGWELAITPTGMPYYIDHNRQETSLVHPITGKSDVGVEGICSSTPFGTARPESSSHGGILSSYTFGLEFRKHVSRRSHVGSWVKGPGLRSPDPSTVTHKGWLLKQGSDGLHLWKRRWFVLSEYCLYYYKGPDEDKVLGYIPLPSFKIRPAGHEDRIFKRFAFKAEHQNTRSYFFAADTKEQMIHWMNAISLASILQRDTSLEDKHSSDSSAHRSDRPSLSSIASSNSPATPSADDSDSGFDGYKSRRFHSPIPKGVSPGFAASPVIFEEDSFTPDRRSLDRLSLDEISDSSKPVKERLNTSLDCSLLIRPGSRQPFYANAPPKPKRLNTSYERSSTPDRSQEPSFTPDRLHDGTSARNTPEPLDSYRNDHPNQLELRKSNRYPPSSERRTPEDYGATSSRGDYEDVYGTDNEVLRTYRQAQYLNRLRESYASSRSGGTHLSDELNLSSYSHNLSTASGFQDLPRRPPGPPRPHSADFLDYEHSHRHRSKRRGNMLECQDMRPKSSLGYHEGDFWSEENYATKMRESAIYKSYLQGKQRVSGANHMRTGSRDPPLSQSQIEQRVPPAGAATPDLYVPQTVINTSQIPPQVMDTKCGSLTRGLMPQAIQANQDINVSWRKEEDSIHRSNSFLRSASARLPKSSFREEQLNTSVSDDGPDSEKKVQQREESMKRLLEWKQRMLHSPLTRKSNSRPDSSASSTSSKVNSPQTPSFGPSCTKDPPLQSLDSESYRQQILQELASQETLSKASQSPDHREGHHSQSDSSQYIRDRLLPQGGREEVIDLSNNHMNSNRKRDSRSGGDSRRSVSSTTKCNNNYSSDEQDVLEERNQRRKTKKTTRKTPNGEVRSDIRRNQNLVNSNARMRSPTVDSSLELIQNGVDGQYPVDSHDYVNIDALPEPDSVNGAPKAFSYPVESLLNEDSGSLRAEPVFIDDQENSFVHRTKNNFIYSDKYYATRDPFYVSDVQMPTKVQMNNESFEGIGDGILCDSNEVVQHQYENLNAGHILSTSKNPNLVTSNDKPGMSYWESHHNLQLDSSLNIHKNVFRDDNSIGKYSDSGYDTLRAEITQKKEDKKGTHVGNGHQHEFPIVQGTRNDIRRPETWSPDKFEHSIHLTDAISKVDESKIIKEYSYEYITPEKGVLKGMKSPLNVSSPDLPSLESPRIVQETQQASHKNLVKDRIKSFSSISEQNNVLEKLLVEKSPENSNHENIMHETTHSFRDPLTPIMPQTQCSEAFVSHLKQEFATPEAKKIIAHEAQVKVLSNDSAYNHSHPSSYSNPEYYESQVVDFRDLKSPQDILDSRIHRSNIRNFLFDEETMASLDNDRQIQEDRNPLSQCPSVKDILRNFEQKSSDVTLQEEYLKRPFHSDTELLSNDSSNEDNEIYTKGVYDSEFLPPPPSSFLEDLRQNHNKELSPIPPPRPPKKPHLGGEMNCNGRPKSIRLSLAESIEESLLRSESEPDESWYNTTEGNVNGRPKSYFSALETENTLIVDLNKPPLGKAPPPPSLEASINDQHFPGSPEENYLPMSPPRKPNQNGSGSVALSSSNSSINSKPIVTPDQSIMEGLNELAYEEHTYIEMTGDTPKSTASFSCTQSPDSRFSKLDMSKINEEISLSPESPRYYEIGEPDGQHYEYIYKTGPQYEAIYMEVPNADKAAANDEKPKIPNKPHDLKQLRHSTKKCASDSAIPFVKSKANGTSDASSDADDEASKDFDLIEPPKKPRFSLSDTFRPASYYLSGADPTNDPDDHDSSDSDLVPPPPIPIGLPPEDVLPALDSFKGSRYDFDRKEQADSSSHTHFNCDDSKSFNHSLDREGLDNSMRSARARADSAPTLISSRNKRKPFFEGSFAGLNDDSFILRSEDIYPTSSAYPEDNISWTKRKSSNQESNISLLSEDKNEVSIRSAALSPTVSLHSGIDSPYSQSHHKNSAKETIYENSFIDKSDLPGSRSPLTSPYISLPNHSSSLDQSIILSMSSDLSQLNESTFQRDPLTSSPLTMANQNTTLRDYKQLCSSRNATSSPANVSHNRSSSELSTRSLTSPLTPIHIRGSSNLSAGSETSPRTAPYYYSDVIRDDSLPFPDGSTYRSRINQLNNQRELEANKRQDIGRKVNQISDEAGYRESLHNEIRNSFEYFDGKTIAVPDERNVYEADTLMRLKTGALTPDPDLDARNIYPYGLTVKSDEITEISPISHRRTRSLEGLLGESSLCQWKAPLPLSHDRKSASRNICLINNPSLYHLVSANELLPHNVPQLMRAMSPMSLEPCSNTPDFASYYRDSPTAPSTISPHPLPQTSKMNDESNRNGSTSRLSYHDTYSNTSTEVGNWEDDGQWREQLRRASIRHTRSLETLEEPRKRSSTASSMQQSQDSRSPPKFSLPNEPIIENGVEDRSYREKKCLDEYHVDYREGRINPGSSFPHCETLERTRKGLTSLEEYEWDAIEEKFRKPSGPTPPPKGVLPPNNQAFLIEGLPLSSAMDDAPLAASRNPLAPVETKVTLSPASSLLERAIKDVPSTQEGGRLTEREGKGRSTENASRPPDHNIVQSTPDVVPNKDSSKFGESLPRRSDFFGQNSVARDSSHNSYGFERGFEYTSRSINQGYQHHPHPHSQNSYHHYKSDELRYANQRPRPPPPEYPYAEHEQSYSDPTYQNYRGPSAYRDYSTVLSTDLDRYRNNYLLQESSQNELEEYYRHRSDDYGLYDRNITDNEQSLYDEDNFRSIEPYQQFSDSEVTVVKPLLSLPHPEPLSPEPEEEEEDELLESEQDPQQHGNYFAGVSAGELLGKTHEELVLLLIQLRRHQSALLAARRHTSSERDSQARLAHLDTDRTEEHLRRMAYLEEHLRDLDKQYEMGKPLINLVDNMVKLGSLYRGFDSRFSNSDGRRSYPQPTGHDSLEFSRRILEKRILAEDRKEYELAIPDQIDLEDRLEHTLGDLNARSHRTSESMMELGRRTRQRDCMERELSRLRGHLAVSARRLEETAAENSRLEHEMMMLRQKIQTNMARNAQREICGSDEARHIESEMLRVQSLLEDLQKRRLELSQQIQRLTSSNSGTTELRPSPAGNSGSATMPTRRRHSTWVETDLDRMITRDRGFECGHLVRGRSRDALHDIRGRGRLDSFPLYGSTSRLSREPGMGDYVKSPDFSDVEYPPPPPPPDRMHSPQEPKLTRLGERRFLSDLSPHELPALTLGHSQSHYEIDSSKMRDEFDYDDFEGLDHLRGLSNVPGVRAPIMDRDSLDNKPDGEEQQTATPHLDISEADERMKRFYGILPKEKALEPKTVRIVKRESTERKRERVTPGKKMATDSSLAYVAEDEMESDVSDFENDPPSLPAFGVRTASLPRNYGRGVNANERSTVAARMLRQSSGNTGAMARPSNLPLRNRQQNWKARSEQASLSAHEQLFGAPRDGCEPSSPPSSPSKANHPPPPPPHSPVFKSAAAQEIVKEMAWEADRHRRAVPKPKRRHFTVSSSKPLSLETGAPSNEGARSRDDCDMVRALRPRNHPDVVKSTLSTRDLRFNETTIDTILGAPRKIHIPERYVPDEDDERELTSAEKRYREEKACSIRKMLADSSASLTKPEVASDDDSRDGSGEQSSDAAKEKVKVAAKEKKEREHLLAMNQILAKQVMEKSRMVAARAQNAASKLNSSSSEDDLSPLQQQLPLIQKRENFLV